MYDLLAFRCSNVGDMLLREVVEAVAETTFEALLAQYIVYLVSLALVKHQKPLSSRARAAHRPVPIPRVSRRAALATSKTPGRCRRGFGCWAP